MLTGIEGRDLVKASAPFLQKNIKLAVSEYIAFSNHKQEVDTKTLNFRITSKTKELHNLPT